MSKKKSKHIKSKKKNKNNGRSYKKIAFVIVLILIIIIGAKNVKKEKHSNELEIILNNENITGRLKDHILTENNQVYISSEDVQNTIDNTIYKEDDGSIITTSSKKIAIIKPGEDNIEINSSKQDSKDIVLEKDGTEYLAISELENVYDYEFEYNSANKIITIDSLSKKKIKAYANKNIKIKSEEKSSSKVIDRVKKGNWLIFISENNGLAKVRTQNGKIGYVKKKYLNNFVTEREDFKEKENNDISPEKKLEYDISKKDITTYEKRKNIINLILQEAIKNDKMYVKIIFNSTEEQGYNRFKIEILPIFNECGIKVEF